MKRQRRKPIENAKEIVAEVKLPGLKEKIFDDFVHTDHERGLRLVAGRKRVTVAQAGRVVQEGLREMLANGAPAPRFRNGFGKPVRRPMGKASVIAIPRRVEGAAA